MNSIETEHNYQTRYRICAMLLDLFTQKNYFLLNYCSYEKETIAQVKNGLISIVENMS